MKRNFRSISVILFLVFAILSPSAFASTILMPKTASFEYIIEAKGNVSLVQGDDDYYVIAENSDCTSRVFGEDAFSEDNIFKHYFFNKIKFHKSRVMNSPSTDAEKNIYTKTP